MPQASVLLDDDDLIRTFWEHAARKAGVEFTAFATRTEFLAALAGLSRDTVLYIDAQLGGGVRGEDVAKEAETLGFATIYLATGLPRDAITPAPWIRGVVGKDPPWSLA